VHRTRFNYLDYEDIAPEDSMLLHLHDQSHNPTL
jgi:hypothetical protein